MMPASSLNRIDVVNNQNESRFEAKVGDSVAFTEYSFAGKNIVFPHTEVPVEFEGRGVASKLVETALNYARDNDLKVIPICPFVAAFIRRNPECQPLVWSFK